MEYSPISLDKWLPVFCLSANCRNGISSWEIHRDLGVTQKTAWFMLHRVRFAMQDDRKGDNLSGERRGKSQLKEYLNVADTFAVA